MRYITGTCRTCTSIIRVPVDRPAEELRAAIAERQGYECPGQHVELGRLLDGYDWNWVPVEADEPPTDAAYGHELLTKYPGRLYYLGSQELGTELGIPSLHDLKDLEHVGFGDFANHEWYFLRQDSPRGARFYVQLPR